MNLKKFAKFFLVIAIVLFIVVVLSKIRGKSSDHITDKDITIGKGLVYRVFNSSNNISLEIKCESSKKNLEESDKSGFKDRMLLFGIKGIIFKKGKISSDTKFSSVKGYVENIFMNLFLDGDAKIESEDILLESDHLLMDGNSLISTQDKVEYWLKDLDGVSYNGMEYFIKIDILNLFKTEGVFIKSNKKYNYSTDKLIVLGKSNRLIFSGNALIESDFSRSKGKTITMIFTNDFKKIIKSIISGNGYIFFKDEMKGNFREAYGRRIVATFSENGALNTLMINGNGIVNIKNGKENLKIESDMIIIRFNPENNTVKLIRTLRGSKVNVIGRKRFKINAYMMKINYNEKGEVTYCLGMKNCEFDFRGYNGTSNRIEYDPKDEIAHISGERSILGRKGSRFISSDFILDSKNEKLYSKNEITSTVLLKSSTPVFKGDQIFISSKNVEIFDKQKTIKYSKNVKLVQDSTEIKCDLLEIEDKNRINISGNVRISFENSDNIVFIKGDRINLSDKSDKIIVEKQASIKFEESSVSGRTIEIFFDDNNKIARILGDGDIAFERKDLAGSSDKINWNILKKEIVFSGSALISREKSGETKGEIVKYYPESEKIIITAKKKKRSKTTIK